MMKQAVMQDASSFFLELSRLPPAPIVWTSATIDLVCDHLVGCTSWRSILLPSTWTTKGAWWSEEFRVGTPFESFPSMLTYEGYLQQTNQHVSLQSLKAYAFDTPSTSLADLSTPSAMVVLFILVFLLRRCKAVLLPFFSSIGRRAGRHTHGVEWELRNEVRIFKFGEYVFRLFFHATISVVGIWYFWDKDWWKQGGTKALFQNFPFHSVEPGMTWYYLIQSAYNLEALVNIVELSFVVQLQAMWNLKGKLQSPIIIDWSPNVRGDFREMFVHHIITNLLVIGSSCFRFTRIGSMVFLVHDISDVPVDLSKLANFLKWKAATAVCFASMVAAWAMTRLGVLPFIIYRSVLTESWMVCNTGVVAPIYYIQYRPFFYVLIGLLILLHLAWFTMMLRMGYLLVRKGETHDLSEHKKGEVDGHVVPAATTAAAATITTPNKKSQ